MKKILISLLIVSKSFSLDLNQAIEKALTKNPELLSYKQQITTAQLKLKVDENLYLPVFFGTVSQRVYSETPLTNIPNLPVSFKQSNRSFTTINIGLNQTLYNFGQTETAIEISKNNIQTLSYLYQEKESQLKGEVTKAYIDILIASAMVDVYKKELEAIEGLYRQAEGFFNEGLITKVDLLQTKVRMMEVYRNKTEAEGNQKVALSRLSQLIGEDVQDREFHKVNIKVQDIENLDSLIKKALENRKIIKFYQLNLQQSNLEQRMYSREFFPKLFLQGEYIYTNQNPYLDPKSNFLLTIGATVNFQGTMPYYKTLQARSNTAKLKFEMEDIRNRIILEVKTAYQNYLTAKENYRVSLESLEYAKEYFELVKEQYANQLATNTDLLNAESSLTKALESKEINYYNLLKSYVEIKKATGEELP